MSTTTIKQEQIQGGEWLIRESDSADTFIPEDFNEEQRMVKEMCASFLDTEVLPLTDRLEKQETGLMPDLLVKAGELGLLGASVPEHLGGLGKDFVTSTIVNEALGGGFSFSVALAAHTGIGTLPILYFGTEAQKAKYVPKLASGEWKASYGLTEPNSGSDALSAKTSAVLSKDGKYYLLNGQKCWITNGGFADVYTVFAKVDGEKFTAFIVEKDFSGFTRGPEEHKMGIRGSSTVQLYFQDCQVPVENVLGEIGRGHVIAFNILNIGRLKLGAAAVGAGKRVAGTAIAYANTREQFHTRIAEFGAIQHKIAEMAVYIWTAESALYRVSDWIEKKKQQLLEQGKPSNESALGAAEEYAIECAMLKIFGSEMLDFVVDEAVQIHGGNGFSDEYSVSRSYRDSRINRIFEGTNEINRLLIVDMILKRAAKGRLDILPHAKAVARELTSIPDFGSAADSLLGPEKKLIIQFKKAILMTAGAAVQRLQEKIEQEQEILMHVADMATVVFHAESALLRLVKRTEQGDESSLGFEFDLVRTYLYDAADQLNKSGKDAINAFAEGDEQRMLLLGLKRFTKTNPFNSKEARRRIAGRLIAGNKYPL